MHRCGCDWFTEKGVNGPSGGQIILQNLKKVTKQQLMLMGKHFPRQLMKVLSKVTAADPLNKGSSPFGIGPLKHIELVKLADEFLVDQNVHLGDIPSNLLEEACSARLIGGPGYY
jgi:hypothetical protein